LNEDPSVMANQIECFIRGMTYISVREYTPSAGCEKIKIE